MNLTLFRLLPKDSPIHRLWAGTKLLGLVITSADLFLNPSWWSILVWSVVLLAVAGAAGGGWKARPALPLRPVLIFVLVALTVATLGGGKPDIRVGSFVIGVGGLVDWLQAICLVVLALLGATILGWTTRPSDLPPALRRLLSPLRRLGVPVDDLVLALALAIRALPLVGEEARVILASFRQRQALRSTTSRLDRWMSAFDGALDMAIGWVVASMRRADEMAQAMESRGGIGQPNYLQSGPGRWDYAALLLLSTVAVLASML
jgi:energy-coupling factor transport system permease protein